MNFTFRSYKTASEPPSAQKRRSSFCDSLETGLDGETAPLPYAADEAGDDGVLRSQFGGMVPGEDFGPAPQKRDPASDGPGKSIQSAAEICDDKT